MRINVLNLHRRPDRKAAFERNNPELNRLWWEDCVDGPVLGADGLRKYGVNPEQCPQHTLATIGNHLSHLRLWALAAASGCLRTIAEDDAVFAQEFPAKAQAMIAGAPSGWHIIYWGWTLATPLIFEIAPGYRSIQITASLLRPGNEAESLRNMPHASNLHRVYAVWNSFAYTLSPRGASKLLQMAAAIDDEHGVIPGVEQCYKIYGVDAKLSSIADRMNAYVAFPPLAHHLHDPADTDMLPDGHVPRVVPPSSSPAGEEIGGAS